MDKKILDNLIKFSKELENNNPEKSAYWHLQELRNEIQKQALILFDVSKRRELLIAFGRHIEKEIDKDLPLDFMIDEFESN